MLSLIKDARKWIRKKDKKTMIRQSIVSFQKHWLSHNPGIRFEQRSTWPHPTKSVRCYLPLMIISMQKIQYIGWFFPVILVIKESCILIRRDKQMATLNQKCSPQILPSLDEYFHAYKSMISIDFFQRSCWLNSPSILLDKRHTWPHPTKTGSLGCYFALMIISMQKF